MGQSGREAGHRTPLVAVLSGPGGAGKGTIARMLVEADASIGLSISWTTRQRRPDDAGDAYVFVGREAFEEHRAAGGFLEWNEFLGHLYGTPVPGPSDHGVLLLEIDVAGGRQVLERDPGALCLFVDAPDDAELRRRLLERGDAPDRAEERIAEAVRERVEASELGYTMVVNDDLESTFNQVRGLVADALAGRGG